MKKENAGNRNSIQSVIVRFADFIIKRRPVPRTVFTVFIFCHNELFYILYASHIYYSNYLFIVCFAYLIIVKTKTKGSIVCFAYLVKVKAKTKGSIVCLRTLILNSRRTVTPTHRLRRKCRRVAGRLSDAV